MTVPPPSAPDSPSLPIPADTLPPPDVREAALYERLAALGIAWITFSHAPVFTVEEAQTLRGSIPGVHTKNLFLEDKKGLLWLVVARENRRLDLNALARTLGRPRFSFGAAERLFACLGVAPGAVTPFALMNDTAGVVTAVFDAGLFAGDPVNFHPLRNDRTTALEPDGLLRFAQDCGHAPLIIDLPERA